MMVVFDLENFKFFSQSFLSQNRPYWRLTVLRYYTDIQQYVC